MRIRRAALRPEQPLKTRSDDCKTLQIMSTTPSARKRKRGMSDAKESGSLSIELSSLPDTQVGPVLGVCVVLFESVPRSLLICLIFGRTASFPCLIPPKSTAFNVFVKEEDEGMEFAKRSSTVSGETATIEFYGSANEGSDGSKCGQLIGSRGTPYSRFLSVDTSSHSIDRDRRNSFCSPLRCTRFLDRSRPSRTSNLRNLEARSIFRRVAC